MHSKWQIWDFFSSFDRSFLKHFNGVIALNTFDPLCLKLVKDFLIRGSEGRVLHHKLASEVSRSWIEEEFQTLSLFGESDCFFVHQAQDLSTELMELFSAQELTGRFVILSLESEGAVWKRILKENKIESLQIEAPRFWEINKLLDFVCAYLKLPLSFEAKNWILNSLENNLSTFYNACSLIKLNHLEAREVGIELVKELLTLEKLDQFAMASLYARKKNSDFFERLVSLEGDFDKMRAFFNFMQSHLIKMADTSYLAAKPRLTQYDKELQSSAKLWRSTDLMKEIARFNHWELMSKKKDRLLWHELRESYLWSLGSI